ncbi:MAG: hypothetical protein WDZ47_09040 [Bacteroidales bacterium]
MKRQSGYELFSTTDDKLPPYLAGNPPFSTATSLITSGLNTERPPPDGSRNEGHIIDEKQVLTGSASPDTQVA